MSMITLFITAETMDSTQESSQGGSRRPTGLLVTVTKAGGRIHDQVTQ